MNSGVKRFINDWVFPILIAGIIALLINKFVFFNIKVPSGSMIPTIEIGDRISVLRVHNVNNLKRGDIVVFDSKELNMVLVKRLIGLPGDTVDIKPDGMYINNEKIQEPYVVNKDTRTGSYKVPEGKFFFLGDNRPVSYDARSWNDHYIPASDIRGKAVLRIFPLNRFGLMK